MAGHARLNWEVYLSHSDRPSVALTRFHLLPLQAFESLLQLYEARATYEEFCIPMCMLPATISNNVPGTDLSIGADTALNAIVEVRRLKHCCHNCKHFVQNTISLTVTMKLMVWCLYSTNCQVPEADVQEGMLHMPFLLICLVSVTIDTIWT